jgi:hypothetical protein
VSGVVVWVDKYSHSHAVVFDSSCLSQSHESHALLLLPFAIHNPCLSQSHQGFPTDATFVETMSLYIQRHVDGLVPGWDGIGLSYGYIAALTSHTIVVVFDAFCLTPSHERFPAVAGQPCDLALAIIHYPLPYCTWHSGLGLDLGMAPPYFQKLTSAMRCRKLAERFPIL